MILTTKTCDTCKHFPNDKHCVGCVWDEDKQENTKWELEENLIVIERERGVLDAIRAEISKLQTYKCFEDTEKLVALDEVLQIIDKYRGESKDADSD